MQKDPTNPNIVGPTMLKVVTSVLANNIGTCSASWREYNPEHFVNYV